MPILPIYGLYIAGDGNQVNSYILHEYLLQLVYSCTLHENTRTRVDMYTSTVSTRVNDYTSTRSKYVGPRCTVKKKIAGKLQNSSILANNNRDGFSRNELFFVFMTQTM